VPPSLRRLSTDVIHLYQAHAWDPMTRWRRRYGSTTTRRTLLPPPLPAPRLELWTKRTGPEGTAGAPGAKVGTVSDY